jgi:hypothetical protein
MLAEPFPAIGHSGFNSWVVSFRPLELPVVAVVIMFNVFFDLMKRLRNFFVNEGLKAKVRRADLE